MGLARPAVFLFSYFCRGRQSLNGAPGGGVEGGGGCMCPSFVRPHTQVSSQFWNELQHWS